MQHAFTWQPVEYGGAPANIRNAVQQASAQTGVSFSYLMEKAAVESAYRADAKASTSSATGLFQFIESTWLGMVRDHGAQFGLDEYAAALQTGTADRATRREILALREDPVIASKMAAQYARNNQDHLKRTVGGRIGDTELYLAHFLGPKGAERFLRAMRTNPNGAADAVMPDAAASNRNVFYAGGQARSLKQVYDRFAAKFDGSNGELAVAEVRPGSAWRGATARTGKATQVAKALPTPAPGQVPLMASPSTHAAKMFMAELSFPGEKTANNRVKPTTPFTA